MQFPSPFVSSDAPPSKSEWWQNIRRRDPRLGQVDQGLSEIERAAPFRDYQDFRGIIGIDPWGPGNPGRADVIHPDARPWLKRPKEMWDDGGAGPFVPANPFPYGQTP